MEASPLWLYALLVLGIIVLPGMDMAFVAARALGDGLRGGAAALAGIVAGGLAHMAFGLLGLGLLLQSAPWLFQALLLAGSVYVARLGWQLWQAPSLQAAAAPDGGAPAASAASAAPGEWLRVAGQGLLTCLLNPKAYLFSVTVLPAYLTREPLRALALAGITAGAQIGVYGAVAWAAARGRRQFHSGRALNRTVGALLITSAAFALVQGWRGL